MHLFDLTLMGAAGCALFIPRHPQSAERVDEYSPKLSSTLEDCCQCLTILLTVVLQLPFALLPMLHFVSMPAIMGKFALKGKLRAVSWILW